MAQLVRAIRETVSAGVGQNDPPPQVDSAPTALKVRANPRMIGRAVLNVITGIPHATTAAGGVKVHLAPRADGSWISITLRSPGFLVSGEELLRLFEPFALGRLDLELVVVRGIIGHCSGLITVQERDGARFFRLWLPAHGGSPPQMA
jgi:C4-dicarboxylate-specific signal transduction histidine kinase